jgi:hypothetical protein
MNEPGSFMHDKLEFAASSNCFRLAALGFYLIQALTGCGSSGGANANANPTEVSCGTPSVMTCSGTIACHEFYTQAAADRARSGCVGFGQVVAEGACPSSHTTCCIDQNGSYGNPEGICVGPSDPNLAMFKSDCHEPSMTLCLR